MGDILSQVLTPPVIATIVALVIVIILVYLLSIIWVFRDARRRSAPALLWAIIAIIPVAGLVAYCLMRPPLTTLDQDELDMELDLLARQLEDYGECPYCGYPVRDNFVICPHCKRQLRNVCTRCGSALRPDWTVCPYCTTPVGGSRRNSANSSSSASRGRASASATPKTKSK